MNPPDNARRRLLQSALLLAAQPLLAYSGLASDRAQVVVVGAGMAGLAAALELEALGYGVTLLDAQARIGGRNWTIRKGDVFATIDGTRQQCEFSVGQYLNAGPWRILPGHQRVLDYARQFRIELEPVLADLQGRSVRPVGGMDVLPLRLAQALTGMRINGAVVHSVSALSSGRSRGVAVGYRRDANEAVVEADYALLALPMNLLASLQLSPNGMLEDALGRLQLADAAKIAFELNAVPEYHQPTAQESLDWQLHWPQGSSPQQRIVSLYANGRALRTDLAGTDAEQIAVARRLIDAKLQEPKPLLLAPALVQWSRIPYQRSAAARFIGDQQVVEQLKAGLPPLFVASDALSSLNGWQEGAVESAQDAVRQLHRFHAGRG